VCTVSDTHPPGACKLAAEIASCEFCREVLSISFPFISSSRLGVGTPHLVRTIEKVLEENGFVRHGAAYAMVCQETSVLWLDQACGGCFIVCW
jgi:hypothetical protein